MVQHLRFTYPNVVIICYIEETIVRKVRALCAVFEQTTHIEGGIMSFAMETHARHSNRTPLLSLLARSRLVVRVTETRNTSTAAMNSSRWFAFGETLASDEIYDC